MLVVTRFRGDVGDLALGEQLAEALQVLSTQRGYVRGVVGRNVDDPTLWVLQTEWVGPGAYRRALSSYDVKMRAWSLLGQAIDEPSAYEVVRPGEELNRSEPRQNG
ncbi:antibiotic biosynthesis monooxygenase [Nocardioides caldifontis]|uniref:antibiotic biosynthesis monooxygenase n=1 Tax=Nocardioides caldifontis TaxID=2588938 RepID=UPI0011DF708C|nr:antibiotic biosynthesis monooxygenase [Nocardioides caldifontis]